MARPESQQSAGYFPTPARLLPAIASILRWPEPTSPSFLLDPCAGDGTAIRSLRELWTSSVSEGAFSRHYTRMAILACELEASRAAALKKEQSQGDSAFHADSFRLYPDSPAAARATVLYLNPPYDTDPVHRRLEHRFLLRFAEHLHPGRGLLFYLVPHYALAPSADFLARHFLEIRAWRLPEPEFSAFKQVLLVGRRARRPLLHPSFSPLILRWAEDAQSLPELPDRCPDPFLVENHRDSPFYLDYELAPHDLTASINAFRPWEDLPVGTSFSARELLGIRFETAMPPRPVHIALALSSGMFNGHRLEPNDSRHPPLLAKGMFDRRLIPESERFNDDGDLVATVEVQRPRLSLTVLRLDDSTFHPLQEGTVPVGGDDVSLWNAADLIRNYDRSLVKLLGEQFPALHDPARPEHRLALPKLARTLYRAQSDAVQGALKLLARGDNPFVLGEVGTGKCTMALSIAAALFPGRFETTLAELRRMGLPDRLRQVERILVVCPPHLLKTWSDEAAAVLPGLAVRIVKTPSDLRRPAQLYILSREDAKLGHGYRGIEGHCPRCGTFLLTSAATNASRRLRCKAISRRPRNRAGRLAVFLGTLLAPSFPEHALTADLATAPALRRRLQGPVRPLPTSRLLDFHDHLVQEIAALFETSDADEEQATLLPVAKLLLRFAAVFQTRSRALPLLKGLLGRGEPSTWGPHAWIRSVVETLENPETEEPTDPTKEILRVLEVLHSLAVWEESPPCGEPLYQAIPQPRRFPLAKVIQRRHASLFDLVVLDEAHEFNNPGSAQSNAAHRLSGLPGVPTLLLSGSLMGGFASSVFTNFWALSRAFREEFDRGDRAAFIDRYGFRRILVSHDGEASTLQTRRFGSQTDREIDSRMTVLGEAPGLMPEFLLRHLLPVAVFIQKADLEVKLPPPIEILSPLTFPSDDAFAPELYAEYRRLQERLLERIRRDRFDPQRSGRLLGALVEMPSYLDLATDDLPPFEIRYPEHLDSELVALGRAFPASWRTPKEVWLLERVAANLRQGNRVLVFLRHTGTPSLPARLLRLLREVTPRAAWLDAKKVSTADREAWIDENVVGKDVQVLLVNPNAVKTGLNNLVCFSTALWYELDLSAYTLRQAPGRLHRIGQTRQVEIETAYYAGTTQEVMLEHVASKVTVSLQADALDLQSALEALGASDAQNTALSTALSLGEAVYRSLNRT